MAGPQPGISAPASLRLRHPPPTAGALGPCSCTPDPPETAVESSLWVWRGPSPRKQQSRPEPGGRIVFRATDRRAGARARERALFHYLRPLVGATSGRGFLLGFFLTGGAISTTGPGRLLLTGGAISLITPPPFL
jgi:hypothetical protein